MMTLIGSNSYFTGFMHKTIYKGNTKAVCVPFMNCYSCPGARFSCPIGGLQAVLGSRKKYVSLYITGFLLLVGILFGRLICGFLCPFGFIQDMIHKIPSKKFKVYQPFTYIKYGLLVLLVILLPMFLTNDIGVGDPYYCKYVCPIGTLEGGIFLVSTNKALQTIVGFLFYYKLTILIIILLTAVIIYRPFCKILCPLGVIYGLMNRISFGKINLNKEACISCSTCKKVCKMEVVPFIDPNVVECIRCGTCLGKCPTKALLFTYKHGQQMKNVRKEEVYDIREIQK
ncbi:4Fe-4S binding protein [Vallitalea pronyensis]|uniref:4Fe-4S binding protein n=2 Tax=Vallitalea pronyensis TaxID=1348613 RepID=A0A8J8MQ52_9FIRM|nr:4Fe-4S binding protein [Vallitalea pronyensis]